MLILVDKDKNIKLVRLLVNDTFLKEKDSKIEMNFREKNVWSEEHI